MTILLLGAGPRFEWLRQWLEAQDAERQASIRIVDGPPTREELVAIAGEPVEVYLR